MEIDNLPIGWETGRLGDVSIISSGCGFPEKYQGKKIDDLPFFKVGDISKNFLNGNILLKQSDNYISKKEANEIKAKTFDEGTIVFAKIGESLKLNRRAILAQESIIDNNIMAVYPLAVLDSKFLFFYLTTVDLGPLSRSSTVPSLRKGDIQKIPMPIPPLAEQRRIVIKLEALGTYLEYAKYSIQKAIQNIAHYRQRLLNEAFNGRMTEAWRYNNEPFTKSNSKLEINANKDDTVERTLFYDNFPIEWTLERLNKVTIKIQDGTHFSPKTQYQEPGDNRFLYISAKNIKNNGVDLDNVSYIDRDVHESIYKRCNVEKGDVLLIKDGATTGIVTRNDLDVQFSLLSSVALIKPNVLFLDTDFLVYFLRSPIGQQQIMEKMTGTAIKRIILDRIRSMIIPIPSIEEQKIISSKLGQIDREYETIFQNLKVVNTKMNLLTRSILNRAFTGHLVPQDSNDEPASVLLNRIKEESSKAKNQGSRAIMCQ